jgi:hypothetical protein
MFEWSTSSAYSPAGFVTQIVTPKTVVHSNSYSAFGSVLAGVMTSYMSAAPSNAAVGLSFCNRHVVGKGEYIVEAEKSLRHSIMQELFLQA